MPNLRLADLTAEIEANVRRALLEDIGSGDITAQLIPAERLAKATIITRDAAVISGTAWVEDRKSTRLNSSHGYISYAVFCLKKKKKKHINTRHQRSSQ